jgi:coenzyme F420-reducing hydrogenase gamma subunit
LEEINSQVSEIQAMKQENIILGQNLASLMNSQDRVQTLTVISVGSTAAQGGITVHQNRYGQSMNTRGQIQVDIVPKLS